VYGSGLYPPRLFGRYCIGSTVDLDARFGQHLRGHTATTKRLGDTLEIVAKKKVSTLGEAREIEG